MPWISLSKDFTHDHFEETLDFGANGRGPSTPELCVAVTNAGGLGNIAAGYLTPEKLISAIQQVEGEADGPYGINIFCPPPDRERSSKEQDLWKRYRVLLETDTQILGELPDRPFTGDDFYREKIDIALSSQAQVVSFTFGYPDETLIHEFQEAGKSVVLNATTPHEIDFLASTSCDAICVQGAEAGGHRATVLSTESEGSTHSTSELLEYALSKVSKPVIAAGGIATAKEALALLRRGAWAIQVGTHFLLADEAGTKHTHKIALKELTGSGFWYRLGGYRVLGVRVLGTGGSWVGSLWLTACAVCTRGPRNHGRSLVWSPITG